MYNAEEHQGFYFDMDISRIQEEISKQLINAMVYRGTNINELAKETKISEDEIMSIINEAFDANNLKKLAESLNYNFLERLNIQHVFSDIEERENGND